MNESETLDISLKTIVSVLESTIFIFLEPLENPPEIPKDWAPFGVGIDYEGETTGTFNLWVEEPFLYDISANILNMTEKNDETKHYGQKGLLEMLNIIAGNLLTNFFGDQQIYHLGLPRLLEVEEIQQDLYCHKKLWFKENEGLILFTAHMSD